MKLYCFSITVLYSFVQELAIFAENISEAEEMLALKTNFVENLPEVTNPQNRRVRDERSWWYDTARFVRVIATEHEICKGLTFCVGSNDRLLAV